MGFPVTSSMYEAKVDWRVRAMVAAHLRNGTGRNNYVPDNVLH